MRSIFVMLVATLAPLAGVAGAERPNILFIMADDHAPTLLALAGQASPAAVQGRSALPILQGKTPADWRTAMYYRYYHYPQDHRVRPHVGIRTERSKLIHFLGIDQWELFDLEADPHELHNLSADPARADLVAQLKVQLARLKADLGDTDQFATDPPRTSVEGAPTP